MVLQQIIGMVTMGSQVTQVTPAMTKDVREVLRDEQQSVWTYEEQTGDIWTLGIN